MIPSCSHTVPVRSDWQDAFLTMLPRIRDAIRVAFSHLPGDHRDEAVQEGLANACVRFARLVERGRGERAFPTVLAQFAVAQVRDGRRVGTKANSRDVCSERSQRRKRYAVERLDRPETDGGRWRDAVLEDRRTSVPDQAGFRVDFPVWLSRLSERDRRLAEALALGHGNGEVARRFAVSSGRVAQLRAELHASWREFHGEGETSRPRGRASLRDASTRT